LPKDNTALLILNGL